MKQALFILTFLLITAGCAQTEGLNTAKINVDQYNKNQMERLRQSGLDEAVSENTKKEQSGDTKVRTFVAPLNRADERVTKKPFGIKIDRVTSPVQPERFGGYHTGVDFEILPGEEDADVPVFAVCEGPLMQKMSVSGYGGVAVQSCRIDGSPVTVVYGHLRLDSIKHEAGVEIAAGLQVGVLGKGYSQETDNERQHLHLGIRRGQDINLLGYVQNEAELKDWIDIMEYLK